MYEKTLKNAIDKMINELPNWREDAVIYRYEDETFACSPQSVYDTVSREYDVSVIFQCHDLDDVFPDFGNCENDATWLLAQIINEQLGTDVSAAAAIMGKKGGRSKSPTKQQASRTNGKLGGRPKKEKDEVVRSREQ